MSQNSLHPAKFKHHVRYLDDLMINGPITWVDLAAKSKATSWIWKAKPLNRGGLRAHAKHREKKHGWTLRIFNDECVWLTPPPFPTWALQ